MLSWPSWLLETPLIITHNGASGFFAGSTDLAYQKAAEDGADIIDCSVQMSKDGVPFCLESADLMGTTTAMTSFMSQSSMVPEIQKTKGIFSFDLTWSEIQSLKRKDSLIPRFCTSIRYWRSLHRVLGIMMIYWIIEMTCLTCSDQQNSAIVNGLSLLVQIFVQPSKQFVHKSHIRVGWTLKIKEIITLFCLDAIFDNT